MIVMNNKNKNKNNNNYIVSYAVINNKIIKIYVILQI